MLSAFVNTFKIAELRQRILFTFGLLYICRIIAAVPLPGVDAATISEFVEGMGSSDGGLAAMLDLFSGGAMMKCTIGTLGIMPYISASIILQLMTAVIPHLSKLAREGDVGRQKITQYTRYLTVIICAVQGLVMGWSLTAAAEPGSLLSKYWGLPLEAVSMGNPYGFILLTAISLVAGSLLMMWLGEQITDRGIGNGVSLIITVNIISDLPSAVKTLVDKLTPVDGIQEITIFHLAVMLFMIFFVILGVVAVTQAQQKVPVQFAKRMVGRKMMQGGSSHLPLRVNYSGVMPIIFASAILQIVPMVTGVLPFEWAKAFTSSFGGSVWYLISFGLMILFFSYFWVATQFNPINIADDLKRRGGYIPGIRPGRSTADYLDRAMTRLTLAGAVFLALIAVMPYVMTRQFNIPWIVASFFGGTSLLIMVGVMLDTMRQIESHLLMRHYDGFLKSGKLRGRK